MQQDNKEHHWKTYDRVIEGNKKFVKSKLAQDPQYFVKLAQAQHPKCLLIGCADSRVPPNELTGTDPGEMFIHRNIANQVVVSDMNLNSVIQYAVQVLKVHHIVILGHSQCGGVKAALSNDSHGSFLDCWISQIKDIYANNYDKLQSLQEEQKLQTLVKLNIQEGMKNIWKNSIIQETWKIGQHVWVHGWLAHLETGFVEEIDIEQKMPQSLNIYKFDVQQAIDIQNQSKKQNKLKSKQNFHYNQGACCDLL